MGFPKSSIILLLIILLFSIVSANSVKASEYNEIEKEVTKLLQTRDLTELADELAANNSTSTKDLLIKISVFGRAGHRLRVQKTVAELVLKIDEIETEDAKDKGSRLIKSRFLETISKAIGWDFESRKTFYEKFQKWGGDGAKSFVEQWKKNGDIEELEKWLFERKNLVWWRPEWIKLKVELGTADIIYDELEQEVRKNPSDSDKILEYIDMVKNKRDVLWLLDVVPTDTAYKTYILANRIGSENSPIKIRLLEKSLTLPFPETEKERFIMDSAMLTQLGITPKNPEKQLRFWTKQALIKIHNSNRQPQLAQPYAEQLAALDTSDILWKEEIFVNAGMTQAVSGKRVVENMILQNEAEKKNTPHYWIERARYYRGRKEEELVWQSFGQALKIFPYKPKDQQILSNRLKILDAIRWEGYSNRKNQIEILCPELPRSKNNLPYHYEITRLTLGVTDEIEESCRKFFTDSDNLIRLMASRETWNKAEPNIIEFLMDAGIWSASERNKVWEKLTKLANIYPKERVPYLAYTMFRSESFKEAIPLLQESLNLISQSEYGWYDNEHIKQWIVESYLEINDWRNAEKIIFRGYGDFKWKLAETSLSAVKSGEITEGVRIWKARANIDRRDLYLLADLAQTEAKPLLRKFYLEIKQKDPLSDIPDKALQILK